VLKFQRTCGNLDFRLQFKEKLLEIGIVIIHRMFVKEHGQFRREKVDLHALPSSKDHAVFEARNEVGCFLIMAALDRRPKTGEGGGHVINGGGRAKTGRSAGRRGFSDFQPVSPVSSASGIPAAVKEQNNTR
jgi:hypothetical protein